MTFFQYVIIILLAWASVGVGVISWIEVRDGRRMHALESHPGRDAFRRNVEAWQILGAGGPLAKPSVEEMVEHYDTPLDEAQAYVDQWDVDAEIEQARERAELADYSRRLVAWIDG